MKRDSVSELTGLKSVQTLQTFKLLASESAPIYFNAEFLPLFLQNNLKAEHRVVKQFEGEDALLKAFYFNMMKLAFEIECEETNYVDIVKKILLSQQQFGEGELSDKSLTDKQYRHFLLEFMEILEHQEIPSFEQTIQWYPIIDQILLKMFKQLVPITLKLNEPPGFIQAKKIFQFLANKFKMRMQVIKGCFKFIQSDIFIYVEKPTLVYLLFVDQLAFIKEVTEQSLSSGISQKSSVYLPKKSSQIEEKPECKKESQRNNVCSKEKEEERKCFGTVINMLDSQKLQRSRASEEHSIKCRDSFEYRHSEQSIRSSDKILESENSLVEDYYGKCPQNSKINSSKSSTQSISTIKAEKSDSSHYRSTFSNYAGQSKQSILSQPQKISQGSVIQRSHTETQLTNTNSVRNNFLKQEKEAEVHQVKMMKKPSKQNRVSFQVSSLISQSSSKLLLSKSPGKIMKKNNSSHQYSNILTQNSLKLDSQLGTRSKLGIFSKVEYKEGFKPLKVAEQIKEEDPSYQKFTDSGLLEILDDEYKDQIRSIKKKFRENRANIKKWM